jgi:hypothetical protein
MYRRFHFTYCAAGIADKQRSVDIKDVCSEGMARLETTAEL